MGLNYVKRARREELDSPNDFVTVALGDVDINFMAHDLQLILDFENKILDGVLNDFRDLEF